MKKLGDGRSISWQPLVLFSHFQWVFLFSSFSFLRSALHLNQSAGRGRGDWGGGSEVVEMTYRDHDSQMASLKRNNSDKSRRETRVRSCCQRFIGSCIFLVSTDVPWDFASVLHCYHPTLAPCDHVAAHTHTHPARTHARKGPSYSTPSAAIRHLNSGAIPVRLLNATDWDEWQTSSASVSLLILLVGWLQHIWYPCRLPPRQFDPLPCPTTNTHPHRPVPFFQGNSAWLQRGDLGVPAAQRAERHAATMSPPCPRPPRVIRFLRWLATAKPSWWTGSQIVAKDHWEREGEGRGHWK